MIYFEYSSIEFVGQWNDVDHWLIIYIQLHHTQYTLDTDSERMWLEDIDWI